MTKLAKLQEIQKENFTQGKVVDEKSTEQEVDEVYEQMKEEKEKKEKEKKEEEEKQSLEERLRIIRGIQPFEKKNQIKEREEEIRI